MPNVLIVGDTVRSPELRHEVPVAIGDPFLYAELDGRRRRRRLEHRGRPHRRGRPDDRDRPGRDVPARRPHPRRRRLLRDLRRRSRVRIARSLGLRDAVVPARSRSGTPTRSAPTASSSTVDQRLFDDRRRRKTPVELDGHPRRLARGRGGHAPRSRRCSRARSPATAGASLDGEPLTCELPPGGRDRRVRRARLPRRRLDRGARPAGGGRPRPGLRPGRERRRVVCDLFPRHVESGCFSDMTRTFTVGTPDPEIVEWHALRARGARARRARWSAPGVERRRRPPRRLRVLRGARPADPALEARGDGAPGRLLPRARPRGRARRPRVAEPREDRPRARRGRRDHARARPLPARLRRRPRRGPPARHRGRLRDDHRLPVRPRPGCRRGTTPRDERPGDRDPARRGAALPARPRRSPPRRTRSPRSTTREPDAFWARAGARARHLVRAFDTLSEWELPYAKWFLGGKLNVAYNCVDRHVEAGLGDRVAYHWEGEPGRRPRDDHVRRAAAATSSRWRTRSRSSASARGRRSRSTWGWSPSCRSRCSPARGSARRTRSSSAASRPTRSRTAMNDMGCEVLVTQDEAWRRGVDRAAQAHRRRGDGRGAGRPRLPRRPPHRATRCR